MRRRLNKLDTAAFSALFAVVGLPCLVLGALVQVALAGYALGRVLAREIVGNGVDAVRDFRERK